MIDYMLFADEANPEQTDPNKFFIYGGVFIPTSQILSIHVSMEDLRVKYGLQPADQLKFNTRAKPASITAKQHSEIKSEVYKIAVDNDVKFCGYGILHAIARDKSHTDLVEFGANILLAKFNQFLGEVRGKGWANFDRLNTETPYGFLQSKFANRHPDPGHQVILERILGYSFTCDGASHASSLADIVIGGFRYIMNEPQRDIAGRSIVASLAPLFWGKVNNSGVNLIGDRGLVLRPKVLKAVAYQADYAEVKSRLNEWARNTSDQEAD